MKSNCGRFSPVSQPLVYSLDIASSPNARKPYTFNRNDICLAPLKSVVVLNAKLPPPLFFFLAEDIEVNSNAIKWSSTNLNALRRVTNPKLIWCVCIRF